MLHYDEIVQIGEIEIPMDEFLELQYGSDYWSPKVSISDIQYK